MPLHLVYNIAMPVTPRECAKGQVYVCRCHCRRHENHPILRYRYLCVLALWIGRYLWKTGFCTLRMAHKHYRLCIFGSACLWFTYCTHSALFSSVVCGLCDNVSILYCYSATALHVHAARRVCALESSSLWRNVMVASQSEPWSLNLPCESKATLHAVSLYSAVCVPSREGDGGSIRRMCIQWFAGQLSS